MKIRINVALTLAATVFLAIPFSDAEAQHMHGPMWGQDRWDPGAMHRDRWRRNHMGPVQRQRMLRHWTFMHRGAPLEYQGALNPLPLSADVVAAGAAIYEENCAACHGEFGFGDGEAGRDLSPSPALLAYLVQMPMAVDEYLLWAISDGGEPFGTDMPAFKGTLSEDDIWKVITYMRAGFPQSGRND